MFFESWSNIAGTAIVAIIVYSFLVVILRVSGKRTLSKWNAFDLVITVALGSSLATAVLSKQVTLAQGSVAFSLFILLQFVVTWLSVRFRRVERIIKARPSLLLYEGKLRRDAMREERVTESEIRAAVRGRGIAAIEEVHAVVLETDGSFSVIQTPAKGRSSAMLDVAGAEDHVRS